MESRFVGVWTMANEERYLPAWMTEKQVRKLYIYRIFNSLYFYPIPKFFKNVCRLELHNFLNTFKSIFDQNLIYSKCWTYFFFLSMSGYKKYKRVFAVWRTNQTMHISKYFSFVCRRNFVSWMCFTTHCIIFPIYRVWQEDLTDGITFVLLNILKFVFIYNL